MVTGKNPPSTPVTAEMYKILGFPFYKLWENEVMGVAGEWGKILGAKEVASLNAKGGVDMNAVSDGEKGKGKEVIREEEFEDRSFDFPVSLLDVDDTIPEFRSVADQSEDNEDDIY